MKSYFKTKRMRKLIKSYRLIEKRRGKEDGSWGIVQDKLCSECDPLNCICRDNQRKQERINLYRNLSDMKLKELEIGDRFISPASIRSGKAFKVIGPVEFNLRAGTATRVCWNETKKIYENKQCRLEVLKLPIK